MKRWWITIFLLCLWLTSTGLIVKGQSEQGLSVQSAAVFKVMPQAIKLNVGDTTTLDLTIEQVKGLYGIEVHLAFDPQVIEVLDADPNRDGVQLEAGSFPSPDFVVLNNADNRAGTAAYAVTQLPPNQPVDGSGTVARVTVRALKSANTQIRVERLLLADTSGKSIQVTSQHGQVQVGGGSSGLLVVVVAFLVVSAGVAIGFVVIKRK